MSDNEGNFKLFAVTYFELLQVTWSITCNWKLTTQAKAKLRVRLLLFYSTAITHDDHHMMTVKSL